MLTATDCGKGIRDSRIRDLASYLELSEKTAYGRVSRLSEEFKIEKGQVIRLEPKENQGSEDILGDS